MRRIDSKTLRSLKNNLVKTFTPVTILKENRQIYVYFNKEKLETVVVFESDNIFTGFIIETIHPNIVDLYNDISCYLYKYAKGTTLETFRELLTAENRLRYTSNYNNGIVKLKLDHLKRKLY